jgi:purine-binding chemotaxis protein CheW
VEHDGRVVPVVDLRRRLGVTACQPDPQTRLLILAVGGDWCGLIVDRVLDVRRYAPEDLAPPPALVRGLAGALVCGTLRRGDDLVVLLDAGHLFSATERRALDAVDAAGVGNA